MRHSNAILRCVFFCAVTAPGNFYNFKHVPPLEGERVPTSATWRAAQSLSLITIEPKVFSGIATPTRVATDAGRVAVRDAGWLLYAGASPK